MKRIITFIGLWCIYSTAIFSQTNYPFEAADVPSNLSVQNGALSISSDHVFAGSNALEWKTSSTQSVCTINLASPFTLTSAYSFYTWIYNLAPAEGTLVVEFLKSNNEVARRINYPLSFQGGRESKRVYMRDFATTTSDNISKVVLTITNPTASSLTLYFDNINLLSNTSAMVFTDLDILDAAGVGYVLKSSTAKMPNKNGYPCDIPLTTPTDKELSDLIVVKNRIVRTPSMNSTDLETARSFVTGLNIIRNTDGTIRKASRIFTGDNSGTFWRSIARHLEVLSCSASANNQDDVKRLTDLTDVMVDQGTAYHCQELLYSDYGLLRGMRDMLLGAVEGAPTSEVKRNILNFAKWILEFGRVYSTNYERENYSDYIYNLANVMADIAVRNPNQAEAVRDLKAASRWLERSAFPTVGTYGFIKPDGTGFHHGGFHPNYLYSYSSLMSAMNTLKGTTYKITPVGYEAFTKAIVSQFLMASYNSGTSVSRLPLCLSARSSIAGSTSVSFARTSFETLIEIGDDAYGYSDTQTKSKYEYLFRSDRYPDAQPADMDGFYQFNYASTGIYRFGNWVAAMRAPTRIWGTEVYSGTGRFGRHQTQGVLEVLYQEGDLDRSGYPLAQARWDWNMFNGSTAVHATEWGQLTPNGDVSSRADIVSGKDFSGALSWGKFGFWSCDFVQGNDWNGYAKTNLAFKKSVYAFDGMLVALGTNISSESASYGNDRITATTIFQSTNSTGNVLVSGQSMVLGSNDIMKPMTSGVTLLTPEGTGFYIPAGNDTLYVKYKTDTAPLSSGSDYESPGSYSSAKAYLKHGVKIPANAPKEYIYVMVPSATAAQMNEVSKKVRAGEVYKVLHADQDYHAVTMVPIDVTAFSFFSAQENLSYGPLSKVGSDMLLMQKKVDEANYSYAVCVPNLRLSGMEDNPTETSVTLVGSWMLSESVPGITLINDGVNTIIRFTLSKGNPIYFNVKSTSSSVSSIKKKQNLKAIFDRDSRQILLHFDELTKVNHVEVLDISGATLYSKDVDLLSTEISVPLPSTIPNNSIALVRIITEDKVNIQKVRL